MNNYHIYEEIGRGKYSVVYKGRKKKTIDYVAVKSVERYRRRKLMNEVRIFHNLDHKNILKFHNWYETRNHLWIIFEYCPAGDLFKLLEEDKKMPEKTVRTFSFDLVEGLSYLHENSIIFADLKPSNIMINEFSRLKLSDFGLSKKISDLVNDQINAATEIGANTTESAKTKAGKHGSPFYMAPELFQDQGVLSFASDFWSLGCIMFEMATGKPPFCSSSLKALIQMILEAPTPEVEGFSKDFNNLIKALLEKDPIKRISWDELKEHNFWEKRESERNFIFSKMKPGVYDYPQQIQFDRYLESRNIVPAQYYEERKNGVHSQKPADSISSQIGGGQGVDILRLSMNVQNNLQREAEHAAETGIEENSGDNQYGKNGSQKAQESAQNEKKVAGDVYITDRSMSLNFNEKEEVQNEQSELEQAEALQKEIKEKRNAESTGQVTPRGQTTTQNALMNNNFMQDQPIQPEVNRNTEPTKQQQMTIEPASEAIVVSQKPSGSVTSRARSPPANMATNEIKPPKPTLQLASAQKDLGLLASNQLFQAYRRPQTANAGQQPSQFVPQPKLGGTLGSQWENKQNGTSRFQTPNVPTPVQTQQQPQAAQTSNKIPHKTIEQLIIHNSDTQVKPIIGNKDIEKAETVAGVLATAPAAFNPQTLPFAPLTPDQVTAKIETQEIEAHLAEVYQALGTSNQTANDKLNSLAYFESIIVNSNVSNRLINSAFMNLLGKQLKNVKSPTIKCRLCQVIGLLIRHSTVIDQDLAESSICTQLVETMKDTSQKVKRRAIAALGEYMFYAATQLDDEQVDPVWELSNDAIQVIVRNLRIDSEGDEVVRFYACKTLENICAQSNSAGHKFTTLETINYLLNIFQQPPLPQSVQQRPGAQEARASLQTSAAVALSHICRLNSQLFPAIFEKITPKIYCQTLAEGPPRVQQAFITMLNLALIANVYTKLNEILLAEASFLPSLVKLNEHQSIVIRGKCLLTFLLLFKLDFRWMSVVQHQVKFFNMLDRVLRDNYKYVQCCLLCLIDGILEIVPTIFQTVAEEVAYHVQTNGSKQSNFSLCEDFAKAMSRDQSIQLRKGGNMFYISVILDLQANQVIRQRMLNYPFIRALSVLLDNSSLLSISEKVGDKVRSDLNFEFQNTLLLLAESVSSSHKVVVQMNEVIINYLLPVLLSKIKNLAYADSSNVKASETRFLSLKILIDITVQLLNDDTVYLPNGSSQDKEKNSAEGSTKQLNQLAVNGLLPLAVSLFAEADPVPFYGQRLLSVLLERNIQLVKVLRPSQQQNSETNNGRNVIQQVHEFYRVGHTNLNKHTIRIVKSLMDAKEMSFAEMRDYKVIDKTYQLIKTMLANKQEWCIELLLDINHSMLSRFNEVVKTQESQISRLIDDIFTNFDICVQMLSLQFEISIVEKASQCLIQMLQLYALCQQKKREIFFVETHIQFLLNALKCEKKIIQKRVLKCIYWALIQSEYTLQLDQPTVSSLRTIVEGLMESKDRSIQSTSQKIIEILLDQGNSQQSSNADGSTDNSSTEQLKFDPSTQMNFYNAPGQNF